MFASRPQRGMLLLAAVAATVSTAPADEPVNAWRKLEQAAIVGQRHDVPLGYSPDLKQFLVLGGRTNFGEYRKPRSYDVLALGLAAAHEPDARWENVFPTGQNWGPATGECTPPGWKNEVWGFQDVEGNVRPNWTVYGTFSLGRKHGYDPDTRTFVFYAGGRTFRYDPAQREWTDLAPDTHPEGSLGGILLWGSMCYDGHNRRFVLFGGGNVPTERGDPGTWTYTPATNEWKRLDLPEQPAQRANSQLVYDPVRKTVVLFGGDTLSTLLADTWTFDVTADRWVRRRPKVSPAPRAAHALVWLPKAQRVLLLGGYTYASTTEYVAPLYKALPFEAWTYDPANQTWRLVRQFDAKEAPEPSHNTFLSAAAGDDDTLVALDRRNVAWTCRIDAGRTDDSGTDERGGRDDAVVQRDGSHDPAWYRDVSPAEPERVAAELRDLPPNRWTIRPTPKVPKMNMDWGSAVLIPELDRIVRFSGGHSAYSGTAPQVYDIATDRYTIPFAPEYPVEYVYSNDQVRGEWSFRGNPWMTGHTYKSTGYDPRLKVFVFAPHDYTYFFDPIEGRWSRSVERNPYRADFYNATVVATPDGAILWGDRRTGGEGLWRLDATTRAWNELPLTGKLPDKSPDRHGAAFDSKRDRLLLFSDVGKNAGNVAAYDLKSGEAKWLDPPNREKGAAPSRETVYVPEWDVVLLAARARVGDDFVWLAYDCAMNRWVGIELAGDDPIGKGTSSGVFHNSVGLMYDPNRRLVWAVGQYSRVHVLKLDRGSAGVTPL